MTDLKFDEYKKSLIGKKVIWGGWVDDVSKSTFLGVRFVARVDNENPATVSYTTPDFNLYISETQAKALKKGQKVRFIGTIDDFSEFIKLTVRFKQVKFL